MPKTKRVLRIFLSHKLGKSREKAKKVAVALSILANDRIVIVYSADFDRGIEWEKKIRHALNRCEWFLLLYDGPDVNHDWCLFEAGYFRAKIEGSPRKKLICLHDPRHSLPNPLRGFTSVPAREDDLKALFKQIYLDEPWKIKPDLFVDDQVEVKEKIQRIIKELSYEDEITAQVTLSPAFTFHVKSEATSTLTTGSIPLDTLVSGDGPWEVAFGKPDATVAWTWGQLVEGLEDWEPWAHQLAGMMSDAFQFLSVTHPSMALRIKTRNGSESIYRVILRRLEKTIDECRFTLSAARIITSYEPHNHVAETRIFHLYNMAWFFRRQFLEKHLQILNDLRILTKPSAQRIEEEIRSIKDDMKALHAEAQVRGVENPAHLIQAFQEKLQTVISEALQDKWPKLAAALQAAFDQEPRNISAIIDAITAMDEINAFFLQVCLEELLRLGSGPPVRAALQANDQQQLKETKWLTKR